MADIGGIGNPIDLEDVDDCADSFLVEGTALPKPQAFHYVERGGESVLVVTVPHQGVGAKPDIIKSRANEIEFLFSVEPVDEDVIFGKLRMLDMNATSMADFKAARRHDPLYAALQENLVSESKQTIKVKVPPGFVVDTKAKSNQCIPIWEPSPVILATFRLIPTQNNENGGVEMAVESVGGAKLEPGMPKPSSAPLPRMLAEPQFPQSALSFGGGALASVANARPAHKRSAPATASPRKRQALAELNRNHVVHSFIDTAAVDDDQRGSQDDDDLSVVEEETTIIAEGKVRNDTHGFHRKVDATRRSL